MLDVLYYDDREGEWVLVDTCELSDVGECVARALELSPEAVEVRPHTGQEFTAHDDRVKRIEAESKPRKKYGFGTNMESFEKKLEEALMEEDGWPKKLDKGRFTEYCKREGFDGPCKACAEKAMKSDDASVRGMASFYLNTVKP